MIYQAFRKAPFLRVLIPLSGGIIFSRYYTLPEWFLWMTAALLILLLLFMIILSDRRTGPLEILLGPWNIPTAVIFQVLFLCLGWMMGGEREPKPVPPALFQARICDEVQEGERSYKTTLDRVFYRSGDQWYRLDGMVQVYFQKEDRCRDLLPGDCLSGMGKLEAYGDPVNPFEFNYGAYQRGRGLLYHGFLDSTAWVPVQAFTGRSLRIKSKLVRLHLMDRISSHIVGWDEKAILYALLLGYRDAIGPDIRQQFVRSGSMHILAVSGLHVGILYLLPAFLIRKIRGALAVRIGANLTLLAGLWGYALLTGLSPSVVRAVTMCTVHRMALLRGRKAGIFHVLTGTALIMILSRPGILFEAGFQLSFAAVAGIAAVQNPLSNLLQARGWLARRAWQLVTVSLAAQLSTAPLSIFYFHQFSHVFILSNLVIIPLATLILYVGLAFMLLSMVGLYPLSGLLEGCACGLKWITHGVSSIPGAFVPHISLLPVQVLLLYVALCMGVLFYYSRRAGLLHAMMASLALCLMVSCIREYRIRSADSFHVFSIPGESAISFVQAKNFTLFRAGRIRGDTLTVPYALHNFTVRHKLAPPVHLSFSPGLSRGQPGKGAIEYRRIDTLGTQLLFTRFANRRVLIMRQLNEEAIPDPSHLETDVLVLVENAACNPDSMIHVFKPGLVIVDGSSRQRYHLAIERACRMHGIPFHSTEKDGFYAF